MKFYPSDLTRIIELIAQNKIKSLLLYGPNRGLIDVIIKKLITSKNYELIKKQYRELSGDNFLSLVNNKTLFGGAEFIKISDVGSSLDKKIQGALSEAELCNLPCFVAGETLPKSGIRNFFENAPDCAAIACYYETPQNIAKIIVRQCNKRGLNITPDAIEWLSLNLHGEQRLIYSELEKLFLYTHDANQVDLETVKACITPFDIANPDQMCIAFAKKEADKFYEEVLHIKQQNINEILIIRALIRYFLNIYYVLLYVEDDQNLEMAMKKLSPPIFYKYVNDFKQVIKLYTAEEAVRMLRKLYHCEIKLKTTPDIFHILSIILEKRSS